MIRLERERGRKQEIVKKNETIVNERQIRIELGNRRVYNRSRAPGRGRNEDSLVTNERNADAGFAVCPGK